MLGRLWRPCTSASWRLFSTQSSTPILLREFIHDSLYHPREGYFQKLQVPVGSLASPIPFSRLLGKVEYLRAVQAVYKSLQASCFFQASWLTPSEIFTPHYGRAVAAYLLQQHARLTTSGTNAPLQIFELGAGTGRLAQDILDFVKQVNPQAYDSCTYTACEISPMLAEVQQERVAGAGGHSQHFSMSVRDGSDRTAWGEQTQEPCFIILMEVLDNCAHDRVCKDGNGQWQQTVVSTAKGGQPEKIILQEQLEPLDDPWIQRCLAASQDGVCERRSTWERLLHFASGNSAQDMEDVVFLPTKALMLFETLCDALPNHHLIASDFNELPETAIAGRNAPLVSATAGGRSQDYGTYLLPRGTADIFFPSDFQLLRRLYASAAHTSGTNATAEIQTTANFMHLYADVSATRTLSGFDPLWEDYTNTSFLLGESRLLPP